MNPTTLMLRWYRQAASGTPSQQPQYTPEEVLRLLRPDNDNQQLSGSQQPSDTSGQAPQAGRVSPFAPAPLTVPTAALARANAVQAVAAQPSAWLGRLTRQQRWELGELADRLPLLLFHYSRGGHTSELLQRFGGWSTWRFDRALEIAASCIAGTLNRDRLIA